ncbi:MAG: hypothetical protein WAV41_04055 [Microgenomates group bacterium]
MNEKSLTPIGIILLSILFLLLSYAGYISYQSIDWTVLTRLESQPLVLPTPVSSPSAVALSPTPSLTPTTK